MLPTPTHIIDQYGTMIATIARRMIQNKELAREAAQEVWYEVFKSLPSFNGNSQLSTWIYTIARRTILRYAANEKRATLASLEEFRALPEMEYTGTDEDRHEWVKERCDWCLTAVNQCLNADARLIFIFRENLALSYKEIGKIMEMKEDNVRQVSSRSMAKVSNFMKDTCPLYNPAGSCKCRIRKQVYALDLDREYASVRKVMGLVNLYRKFEKELPRKNYWEKIIG